jgi:molybdenum cofactor synthesis domain-containing protein
MEPRLIRRAAALVIGNELLSGKIQEANVIELAKTLRALGVSLERVVVLPDDVETLVAELRDLSARFDAVFTSGGVGPTHDDVTIEAVARAFGVEVTSDPRSEAMIRKAYGDACDEAHLRMALVPQGAELLSSPEVEWPTPVMKNVFILPGIPEAFRTKLLTVRAHVRGPSAFVSKAAFVRLDEAPLKPLLDRVVGEHPDVEIGSYPRWFEPSYKTKVTFDGRVEDAVTRALEGFVALLPEGALVRTE